jgi:hypothetical protein
MTVKDVWKDPVGAAVIAGVVLAFFAWVWEKGISHTEVISQPFPVPLWLIIIAVFALLGTLWKVITQREAMHLVYNFEPDIELVNVTATLSTEEGVKYPLKCTVFMRNKSRGCIDVIYARYDRKDIEIQAFTQGVIQIEAAPVGWTPSPHGADRIAVLPGQNFRLWIPIDRTRFSQERVQGAVKQIGTIILTVNGKAIPINI